MDTPDPWRELGVTRVNTVHLQVGDGDAENLLVKSLSLWRRRGGSETQELGQDESTKISGVHPFRYFTLSGDAECRSHFVTISSPVQTVRQIVYDRLRKNFIYIAQYIFRDHWEDQDVGGWTILKWILER
jgi:hypothetical protein